MFITAVSSTSTTNLSGGARVKKSLGLGGGLAGGPLGNLILPEKRKR